jgi:2,5-furandicarboxylate decarboxylase 1
VATRVQADRDVLIVSNARAKPLDPSLPLPVHGKIPTTAKMGIDATIPENIPAERYKRIVYFNQGKIDLKNYLGPMADDKKAVAPKSVEPVADLTAKIVALLEKSHCFFADLLEKFPKADYKSIASAVARLYEEGKINQDKDGKFELTVQISQTVA